MWTERTDVSGVHRPVGSSGNGRGRVLASTTVWAAPTESMSIATPGPSPTSNGERSVGFMFRRPEISDNDAFDAGGLTWTIVTPFEELRIDYSDKVLLLERPIE